MTGSGKANPRVFISYSWTNQEHEEWVIRLAERLMTDSGIHVTLDKWDLKEGQDKYAFMESMVTSEDVDKVLIICDEGYKNRADQRKGGVGEETAIITKKVYEDTKQEKFIPIVASRGESGEEFIPVYIASRIYIDLSDEDNFEENYDKLIRNIWRAPLYKKPVLGRPPSHLFEDETDLTFPTASIVRRMKGLMDRQPSRIPFIAKDFADSLIESFETLKVYDSKNEGAFDQDVVDMIDKAAQLKDDYTDVLRILLETDSLNIDYLVELFENLYPVVADINIDRQYNDAAKFLLNELFIYTVAILNSNYKYELLTEFINSEFVDLGMYSRDQPLNFGRFRFYLKSLDQRNQRLKTNRISIQSDLLVQRAGKMKDDIVAADLLLYYVHKIARPDEYYGWFPITYFYSERVSIKLLTKLKSKKHFEKMKELFRVETKEEFIEKVNSFNGELARFNGGFEEAPSVFKFISPDKICSIH